MPLNLPLTAPVTKPGFGFNLTTFNTIATKAPVVGGIISNLGTVGKLVGIKIDTKTPKQHIAERTAKGEALKAAAMSGSVIAWEKLWVSSGRPLPVRYVDQVARVGDDKSTKANEFFGWPRVGDQLTAMLRQVEAAMGAPPQPSGATTNQVVGMSTDTVLTAGALNTSSQGGTFGGFGFGVGDSPANRDGAQSNAAPSSTNYVVVGGLILAMLLVLRKRR